MNKLKIAQLKKYCEDQAAYNKFYPVNLIQSVYDARTGVRLDRLLATINSIYLPYCGSFDTTMLQVPAQQRRVGLIVTFKDLNGVINTVRYKDTNVSIADEPWANKANWEGWTFDNAIDDLAAALNVIFKDLSSYPDFLKVLCKELGDHVEKYLDEPENMTAVADILKNDIVEAAKQQTEEVWHHACDYADIKTILYGGAETVLKDIFDNVDAHENLYNLIIELTAETVRQQVFEATATIFSNIDDDEDFYNHFVAIVDNKVHDVFYNVWCFKDVADIIRQTWQAKLDNLEADSGLTELLNTLVKEYIFSLLTEAEKYPQWQVVLEKYLSESVHSVFKCIHKYAELIGVIDKEVHESVELALADIEHHTGLLTVIDRAVEGYICEQFKMVNLNTPLGDFINGAVNQTIVSIFTDLDKYPLIKVQFDAVVKNELEKVVEHIDDYPQVKELLDRLAKDNRVKILGVKVAVTVDVADFEKFANGDILLFPVEDDTPLVAGDIAILEFDLNAVNYKALGFAVVVKPAIEKVIEVKWQSKLYLPDDNRVKEIINAVGLNEDGTYKQILEAELKDAKSYREVVFKLLLMIREANKKINAVNTKLDKYIQEANNKFISKDLLGQANGIPTLDENGFIRKRFINRDYENVYVGRLIDEFKFTDLEGHTLPQKDNTIYIDINGDKHYRWNSDKFVITNEQVRIGDGYGEAFEGWRGVHLEEVAFSHPKNIVSDIQDAQRFSNFVQIKYRGKTKDDQQRYVGDIERAINLQAATQELAGVMLPGDKKKLDELEKHIWKFIQEHPAEILEAIRPKGWYFVMVKEVDKHKEIIPEGYTPVWVDRGYDPDIWEDPIEAMHPVTYVNPDKLEDDENIKDTDRVIEVTDGHSAVFVKQTN